MAETDTIQFTLLVGTMEKDWEAILNSRYCIFNVEESLYIANVNMAATADGFARLIYQGLRTGDVPENLIKMYREAVYGKNEKVRNRILTRVYSVVSSE